MGLSDRDYMGQRGAEGAGRARFTPGRAAAPGRRPSVTTWIIIICVGVFVIDGFLPLVWEPIGIEWAPGVRFDSPAKEQEVLSKLVPGKLYVRGAPGTRVTNGTVGVRALTDAAGTPLAYEVSRAAPLLNSYLHFSTSRALVQKAPDGSLRGFEFWRFIGFQFLHFNVMHLAFNMLGLWFFGPIVESTLGGKRYLAFYLLCGICGALMYLLLNGAAMVVTMFFGAKAAAMAPFLLVNDPATPLVGASAGVFGVLMAGAYLVPHATVLLWGIIPMRLDTMAYGLVVVALLAVFFGWTNAGGEAAHLGGAIAGFYFIRHTRHLHGFFDLLGRVDPTSRSRKARAAGEPLRAGDERAVRPVDRSEVDRILRKVSEQGLASLSASEQETLRRAGSR